MGLKLKNPIIAGASKLTRKTDSIKRLEAEGAAAIVYKSLFEEQVKLENLQMSEISEEYDERHPMMIDVFPNIEDTGPREHLYAVEQAKKAVDIPVIASLNATGRDIWVDYAKKLEDSGVDAIELNIYHSPDSKNTEPRIIEDIQIAIIKAIKKTVSIPVGVKLSFFYSNPFNFIKNADVQGVGGFVLFNRLLEPDIDTEKEEYINPFNLSNRFDHRLPLRYTAILYKEIKADICSSTGIFTGKDVAKMILAGASCIQCVSTLYINGIKQIGNMLEELETWAKGKGYSRIKDFRGKLSRQNIKDPFIFGRNQYIDILLNQEPIIRQRNM
jgi:dihydroorotate dehydrogenase (fumarate)